MINLTKKPFANLTKKIQLEECKNCKETGEELDSFDDMWGNNTEFWRTCDYCEGEGKVEENPSWLK
jgi:DnaJ-class molecular chaperone